MVRILFWNGGIVVRVTSLNQSADDVEVVEGEECIGVVVLHVHLQLFFACRDDITKHRHRFAGQNKRYGCFVLDVVAAITYQFVCIGGNKRDVFWIDFA